MIEVAAKLTERQLNIDTEMAVKQLRLLGYTDSDKIYLREFAGKPAQYYKGTSPSKNTVTLDKLPKTQSSLRGLYFVINGQGQAKEDIKVGRCIFFEHDSISKEEQLFLWQKVGLPEPTLQVETRNSIHNYWTFTEAIPIEQWQELILDLIKLADADATNKDPSRVFRLAGAHHIACDEQGNELEPFKCQIVSESGKKYTYEELREVVPALAPEARKNVGKKEKSKAVVNNNQKSNSTHLCQTHQQKKDDESLLDWYLKEVEPRLDPLSVYSSPAHQWSTQQPNKLRGGCPWHESKSGSSFHCEPNGERGQWLWECPSCQIGGGYVEYIDRINGGSGSPRGKDWVACIKVLAEMVGLEIPDFKPKAKSTKATKNSEESEEKEKILVLNLTVKIIDYLKETHDSIRLNIRTQEIEVDDKPINLNTLQAYYADKYRVELNEAKLLKSLVHLAEADKYDPVQDWLLHCHKNNPLIDLKGISNRLFGNDSELYDEYFKRFLLGAVERAFNPGEKFDEILVLQGSEGTNKSSLLRLLSNGFFTDSISENVNNKDEKLKAYFSWIIELAECDKLTRKADDDSSIKSFLSGEDDLIRVPYGRTTERRKRNFVFTGTTNKDSFLPGVSGNRRWWVIPVQKKIDLIEVRKMVGSLWATAVDLYLQGERGRLPEKFHKAQKEQVTKYGKEHLYESVLYPYLSTNTEITQKACADYLMRVSDVKILPNTSQMYAVLDVMRKAGFNKTDRRINGCWIWESCPEVQQIIEDTSIVQTVEEIIPEVQTIPEVVIEPTLAPRLSDPSSQKIEATIAKAVITQEEVQPPTPKFTEGQKVKFTFCGKDREAVIISIVVVAGQVEYTLQIKDQNKPLPGTWEEKLLTAIK